MATAMDRPRPDRRGGLLRILVVCALAASFAGLAASHALGQILLRDNPRLALRFGPGSGEARARNAWREYTAKIDPKQTTIPSSVPRRFEDEAKRAFSTEPTSATALRILALAAQRDGAVQARRVMRMVGGLNKREPIIDFWLILDYAKLGELKPLLSHYDNILRTAPEVHERMMPLLVAELRNPAATSTVATMLRRRPPWGENFWNYVLLNPDVAVNAARLRGELGDDYDVGPSGFDSSLVSGLIQRQRYSEAFQAFAALSKAGSRSMVRDPGFNRVPEFPPLEWEVFAAGAFVADIDPRAGWMTLSAESATPTVFARQLIRILPGQLRLRSEWQPAASNMDTSLEARLRCAGAGKRAKTSAFLPQGKYTQTLAAPAGCAYAWLELSGSGSGTPFEATVQELNLELASSRSENTR